MIFSIEIRSRPDHIGLQQAVITWTDEEGKEHGLWLNAVIDAHAEALRKLGHTVILSNIFEK